MSHQRPHREQGAMEGELVGKRRPGMSSSTDNVGIGDVFLPHDAPKPAPHPEAPSWLRSWETHRPKILMECCAEFFGVCLYCWAGMGATTTFIVTAAAKEEGYGSLLNIALCYTFAIVVAITLIGQTSGAHLNPCMTIAFAVFKGFPWWKVLPYIISQIFGGFIAGCLVYAQFAPALSKMTKAFHAAGMDLFTPASPAGGIALFQTPGADIGITFVNEFISTIFIGVTVFSVLDPSNHFIVSSSAPFVIALIYFMAIICYAPNFIALNTARDLGGRMAAACFWGHKAFPARYTALTCLTNIAGTLIGAAFQILFLGDTVRPPTSTAVAVHQAQTAEKEAHLQRVLTAKANSGGEGGGIGRMVSTVSTGLQRTITPLSPKANGETTHVEKSMA